jgi:glycosyltransferase involved in cell wall biosynthesis
VVVSFPYDGDLAFAPARSIDDTRPRVIWAGRFDRQKRPELLLKIAKAAPDLAFDVHGLAVVADESDAIAELRSLQNVAMHGPFERFDDLVADHHVAYLHTSAWEGVPTILMDVIAARVPVCAPMVGGIPDLIPKELLISDVDDPAAYIARLRSLACSEPERQRCVLLQLTAMENGRRWQDFVAVLDRVEGYFGLTRDGGVNEVSS